MTRFVRRFMKSPSGVFGAAIFLVILLCALMAPILSHQNPYDMGQFNILDSLLPPGAVSMDGYVYWLGTDDQGRDLVSAILYGLRISIFVAVVSTLIALAIGVAIGLSAAYIGGRFDSLVMRLVDLQLSLPSILIALILVALMGTGLEKIIIAIVAAQWATFARTLRSAAMVERTKEYILAARLLRYSSMRIMLFHLLPNSIVPLTVMVVVEMAAAIALEATLSFLGVGLPVTQPSLGLLIANGYSFMLSQQYWLSVGPGVVLLFLLFSVNLIGETMRKINDPRMVIQLA
jgi:peptide/nickel transport system permease protein